MILIGEDHGVAGLVAGWRADSAAQELLRRSQDEVERGEVLDEAEVVAKRRMSAG